MKQIKCKKCGRSDCLEIYATQDDWFLDKFGQMKRRSKIEREISCYNCGEVFTVRLNTSSLSKDGKETLFTQIDLTEWNIQFAIHPKTGKAWKGKTNGKTWGIIRIFKNNNSVIYFGSMFGCLVDYLDCVDESFIGFIPDGILNAQIGMDKQTYIENGERKSRWKQTLLINPEHNGYTKGGESLWN